MGGIDNEDEDEDEDEVVGVSLGMANELSRGVTVDDEVFGDVYNFIRDGSRFSMRRIKSKTFSSLPFKTKLRIKSFGLFTAFSISIFAPAKTCNFLIFSPFLPIIMPM